MDQYGNNSDDVNDVIALPTDDNFVPSLARILTHLICMTQPGTERYAVFCI